MKVALNAFLIYANHHVDQNAAGLISWCEIKDVTYREDAVASSAAGKVLARPGASDAAVSALTGTDILQILATCAAVAAPPW